MAPAIERLSIELSRTCAKACWFCYNHSNPEGDVGWSVAEVVDFVSDCAANRVRAVSFGGGEPLESPTLLPALLALRGRLFRSVTTSGLPLDGPAFDALVTAAPDKVHVSIHHPDRSAEVGRVIRQVKALGEAGLTSGVNLLVARSMLEAARDCAAKLADAGIGPERVMYLPMRGTDTPSPDELGQVAGKRFQSVSCLTACGPSPRFVSIDSEKRVAWCSYTSTRRGLATPDHAGLVAALAGLGLRYCGAPATGSLSAAR